MQIQWNTMNMQSGINDIVDIANKASTTTIKSHSVSLVKISQNGTKKCQYALWMSWAFIFMWKQKKLFFGWTEMDE